MKSNVSIYDVAKEAGVSIATVSRVINGIENVSEKKKEIVMSAIKKLEYVPSESARRLAGNQTGMIGVSISFSGVEGSYMLNFLRGALKALEETNYSMVLINEKADMMEEFDEPTFLDYIKKKSIDALLLSKRLSSYNDKVLDDIIKSDFNISYSGEMSEKYLNRKNIFSINHKRAEFIMDSLEYLFLKGHTQICMYKFAGKDHKRIQNSAIKSFEEKHGRVLKLKEIEIELNGNDYLSESELELALNNVKEGCSAVFALSLNMAVEIKNYFEKKGYKISKDFSLMNINWEDNDNIEIDNIKMSVFDLGFYGMENLVKKLRGDENLSNKMLLDYSLVEKGSVRNIN